MFSFLENLFGKRKRDDEQETTTFAANSLQPLSAEDTGSEIRATDGAFAAVTMNGAKRRQIVREQSHDFALPVSRVPSTPFQQPRDQPPASPAAEFFARMQTSASPFKPSPLSLRRGVSPSPYRPTNTRERSMHTTGSPQPLTPQRSPSRTSPYFSASDRFMDVEVPVTPFTSGHLFNPPSSPLSETEFPPELLELEQFAQSSLRSLREKAKESSENLRSLLDTLHRQQREEQAMLMYRSQVHLRQSKRDQLQKELKDIEQRKAELSGKLHALESVGGRPFDKSTISLQQRSQALIAMLDMRPNGVKSKPTPTPQQVEAIKLSSDEEDDHDSIKVDGKRQAKQAEEEEEQEEAEGEEEEGEEEIDEGLEDNEDVDRILPRNSENFPPLTRRNKTEIDSVLNQDEDRDEIVCPKLSTPLPRDRLLCMKDYVWLNDEVINAYMELMRIRQEAFPDKHYPRCHFFSTFFYSKLTSDGYNYNAIRRWTRKVDLFSMDKIIIPVHLEIHWVLAVVNLRDQRFEYYDSLLGENHECLDVLAQYLADELKDKKQQVRDFTSWPKYQPQDIPQQMNGCDCGVFMCRFADYVSRDRPFDFIQSEMNYFRRLMTFELVKGRCLTL